MSKIIKKLLITAVVLALVVVMIIIGYVAYVDIHASDAKEYLMEKYDFKNADLLAKKYTEYVYEDVADCKSLWFKKCTSESDLLYEYSFELKDGTEIIVSEYEDGTLVDNYKDGAEDMIDGAMNEISDEQLIEDFLN